MSRLRSEQALDGRHNYISKRIVLPIASDVKLIHVGKAKLFPLCPQCK